MTTRTFLAAATMVAFGAARLLAQADSAGSRLACASGTAGARVSIGADSAQRVSSAMDTTVVLRIDDRTWTRDSLAAGVAFGASGTVGARSAPWRVCTGASANLGRVSASLHGVYGQIHLRIDPSALRALGNPTAAPARR